MEDLTFGEQVKVVLSRKGMTIKELAEIIEEKTGMTDACGSAYRRRDAQKRRKIRGWRADT